MDMPAFRVVAAFLLSLDALSQTFGQTVRSLQAKNPPDALLKLRIERPARFREGELILFTLASPQVQFGADRIYHFEGFLVDPPTPCGRLGEPCSRRRRRVVGGSDMGSPMMHGELNAYIPSLKPGHYRLAALEAVKVKQRDRLMPTYSYMEPREHLVSNVVELDIVPASREWQQRVIAAAVRMLNGSRHSPAAQAAARRLQYLQTPAAWEAALDHLQRDDYTLLDVLATASDQNAACALLDSRLSAARQLVDSSYLLTLATVCSRLEWPPVPKVDLQTAEGQKAWEQWNRQVGTIQARFSDRAAAKLAAHLNQKTRAIKSVAAEALVQYAASREDDAKGTAFCRPAWVASVRRELIREWPRLTSARQRSLLSWQWQILRGPDMARSLEVTANRSLEQSADVEGWRLAIRRLNDLDPAKAQRLIIEDMLQPASRVDKATLALLPPDATKELTPRLIQALAAAQSSPRGNPRLTMELLARYGDAESLPRIRAVYESQTGECQAELLAYFLRVDPAYAERILPQAPWNMQAPAPPCTMQYFVVTARLYMSPVLEKFMTAYLMHSNVDVKKAAAESLGKHGTAAAEGPLWEALRHYHKYWEDRRDELKNHLESERLELALRNAIARGAGWLATEADMRSIAELCLNQGCRYETENDLRTLRLPLTVDVYGNRARVAQYQDIDSLEALERKLGQFPMGTIFQLRVRGSNRDRVIERLEQLGARKQIAFRPIP